MSPLGSHEPHKVSKSIKSAKKPSAKGRKPEEIATLESLTPSEEMPSLESEDSSIESSAMPDLYREHPALQNLTPVEMLVDPAILLEIKTAPWTTAPPSLEQLEWTKNALSENGCNTRRTVNTMFKEFKRES